MKLGWSTLEDSVRALLKEGKSRHHADFQALIQFFGEEKIVAIVTQVKEQWKQEREEQIRKKQG